MQKIRIGIIGMGNMGCQYAEWILAGEIPELTLVAVTRIKQSRREWAEHTLPSDLPIFQTAEELLAMQELDAVLIATPHRLHPEQTIAALQRGLHVLCDKPAGVYAADAARANDEATKQNLVYGMIFNQRTNPMYQKLRELVQSGRYGKMKRVVWTITNWYRPQAYYESTAWRATWEQDGGGVLLNQCPHNLDLLQWICGMPEKVQAFCHEGKWHTIEVEDDVTAYLEFPGGATGVFIASTGEAPGVNRLEISLENARILCEDGILRVYELAQDERAFCYTAKGDFDRPTGEWIILETGVEKAPYRAVLQNFAGAILRREALVAEGTEGINSLLLSNGIYLSSWLGQMVELPVDEELFYREMQKKIQQ